MFSHPSFIVDFFTVQRQSLVAAEEPVVVAQEAPQEVEKKNQVDSNPEMLLTFIFLFLQAACSEEKYSTEATPILVTLTIAMKQSAAVKKTLQDWLLGRKWPNNMRPEVPQPLLELIKKREAPAKDDEEEEGAEDEINAENLVNEPSAKLAEEQPKEAAESPQVNIENIKILDSPEQFQQEQGLDENVAHPKPQDFDAPDMEENQVKSVLVRFMTSSNYNLKSAAGEFMFILCDESPDKLTAETGIGNSIGLLAERGFLGNLLNQQ